MLTEKEQISVKVDREIIDKIDKITDNRSQAIEAGLQLWYVKKIEEQVRSFYENRPKSDIEDEREWLEFVEAQIEEVWNTAIKGC